MTRHRLAFRTAWGIGGCSAAFLACAAAPVAEAPKGVADLVRGCDEGEADSCRAAAGTYADAARGRERPEKACEASQNACENAEKVVRERQPAPTPTGSPKWSTTFGSLTIGSGGETATFTDTRATCGPIELTIALGVSAAGVRSCLEPGVSRAVLLQLDGGRVLTSSVTPDDAVGRCVLDVFRATPLGTLTCTLEASVSR